MRNDKQGFRESIRKLLNNLSSEQKDFKSKCLSQLLKAYFQKKEVDSHFIIGGFAPLDDEPNWKIELSKKDFDLSFPALDENGQMNFYRSEFDQLESSKEFGAKVLIPSNKNDKVSPDLVLVPGVVFNYQGKRIGRGKGFYDRCLPRLGSNLKIGICFDEQLIDKNIPVEEHDQSVDVIVTDLRVLELSA